MQVLAVGSQGEMLEHQAAARGLALPTHTYATLSKEQGRGQRSVMAVGPAPAELLDQVRLLVDLSRDLFSLWRFCSAALWWFGLKQISAVVHQVGFGEGLSFKLFVGCIGGWCGTSFCIAGPVPKPAAAPFRCTAGDWQAARPAVMLTQAPVDEQDKPHTTGWHKPRQSQCSLGSLPSDCMRCLAARPLALARTPPAVHQEPQS